MTPPIRGITLLHPWAFCIQRLGKRIENRTWPPQRQGGCAGMYLAVHGGAQPKGAKLDEAFMDMKHVMQHVIGTMRPRPGQEPEYVIREDWDEELTPQERRWLKGKGELRWGDFIAPGIVAVARLAGVTRNSPSRWAVPGQYHWTLADVTPIEPIPYRGAQGLWTIEDHTLAVLRERWAAAHDGQVVF